jgi:GNAT superfamily N-acetyltransferase
VAFLSKPGFGEAVNMIFREMAAETFTESTIDAIASTIIAYYRNSSTLISIDLDVVKKNWYGFVSSGMAVVIVAEDQGKIAGVISGLHYPDPLSGRGVAQEVFWFVDPEYRYLGIGESLLKLFSAWAKVKGASAVRVAHLVDLRAEENRKLYESLGFKAAEVSYEKEV